LGDEDFHLGLLTEVSGATSFLLGQAFLAHNDKFAVDGFDGRAQCVDGRRRSIARCSRQEAHWEANAVDVQDLASRVEKPARGANERLVFSRAMGGE